MKMALLIFGFFFCVGAVAGDDIKIEDGDLDGISAPSKVTGPVSTTATSKQDLNSSIGSFGLNLKFEVADDIVLNAAALSLPLTPKNEAYNELVDKGFRTGPDEKTGVETFTTEFMRFKDDHKFPFCQLTLWKAPSGKTSVPKGSAFQPVRSYQSLKKQGNQLPTLESALPDARAIKVTQFDTMKAECLAGQPTENADGTPATCTDAEVFEVVVFLFDEAAPIESISCVLKSQALLQVSSAKRVLANIGDDYGTEPSTVSELQDALKSYFKITPFIK